MADYKERPYRIQDSERLCFVTFKESSAATAIVQSTYADRPAGWGNVRFNEAITWSFEDEIWAQEFIGTVPEKYMERRRVKRKKCHINITGPRHERIAILGLLAAFLDRMSHMLLEEEEEIDDKQTKYCSKLERGDVRLILGKC